MAWPRLLILLLGLAIILGLMLWLISSLQWLYAQVALTSPFLANLLVFCLIALMAVLIGVLSITVGSFEAEKAQATASASSPHG